MAMCGRRLKANDAGGTKPDTKQSRRRRQLALVAALMSALVVVGVVNFVLVKILYVAFRSGGNEINASVANQSLGTSVSPSNSSFANGSQYSFFVNQVRGWHVETVCRGSLVPRHYCLAVACADFC